jgi:K+-transporting ATPase KdpF subunit
VRPAHPDGARRRAHAGLWRRRLERGTPVNILTIVLAVVVFCYLLYAMLRPEEF